MKTSRTEVGIAFNGTYVRFPNLKVFTGPETALLTGVNFEVSDGAGYTGTYFSSSNTKIFVVLLLIGTYFLSLISITWVGLFSLGVTGYSFLGSITTFSLNWGLKAGGITDKGM